MMLRRSAWILCPSSSRSWKLSITSRGRNGCAYAFEARVGAGRLFVSTWRLTDSAVLVRPEARYLLSETIHYLLSEQFARLSG